MKKLRYPAVPLATVDPFFSIWSFADCLYDDSPRNWCGKRNAMTGMVSVDGVWYRFLGKVQHDDRVYLCEPDFIPQKSVRVEATTTIYEFENDLLNLKLTFRTPLLCDDLFLMSRPVSYISYDIRFSDGKKHDATVYFDIGAEVSVENTNEEISFGKTDFSFYCGKGEKDVLYRSGDEILIEWGNVHLVAPDMECAPLSGFSKREVINYGFEFKTISEQRKVCDDFPVLSARKSFEKVDGISGFLCVAYEDFAAIEFFGEKIKGYWTTNGDTFADVCKKALMEYDDICKRCDEFDKKLREMGESISSDYADLVCLAYRQVVAAHKLIEKDGKLQFLSKECYSNGCIGTVDVTYPSIPMFLIFNPDLVEGMLNPVFEFAEGNHGWNFDFAPHDVGQYPLANGQVYGYLKEEDKFDPDMQMPVEECGNMLLCVYASCLKKKNFKYAGEHYSTLKKWADYLVSVGFDPESQLCTDDFAGHLAHNCNLSVKGILGIASFGKIAEKLGENGSGYAQTASEYAAKWKMEAFSGDHYALAFDKKDTWSLKYNLALDKVLKLNVFDEDIFKTEVEYYKTKFNEYGLPLDCREDYTKSDWLMWSVCLSEDMKYREMIIGSMWKFLNSCKNRVPFGDWYYTSKPVARRFQGRSVQGGLFLPIVEI